MNDKQKDTLGADDVLAYLKRQDAVEAKMNAEPDTDGDLGLFQRVVSGGGDEARDISSLAEGAVKLRAVKYSDEKGDHTAFLALNATQYADLIETQRITGFEDAIVHTVDHHAPTAQDYKTAEANMQSKFPDAAKAAVTARG
jgi:hypothetical protein